MNMWEGKKEGRKERRRAEAGKIEARGMEERERERGLLREKERNVERKWERERESERMVEWERRVRGWRARERKWRGAIVDSESHLASRLLFIVPCYSGFPRQSGRDAIKKRKQERRTRGRGGRESSCWGKSAWARNEMSGIGWNRSAWHIDHRIRDFSIFFSLNNFDRTRNRDNTTTIIRIINRDKLVASFLITIEVSIPVFDRLFPVDDSSDLFFFFFSFSKSEFPKKIDRKERNPCTVSMLEKNKYVKETSIIFFFFFFSFNELRFRVM